MGWLGIDIGSLTVATVVVDDSGEVRVTAYRRHRGRVAETIRAVLDEMGTLEVDAVACTGSGAEGLEGVGDTLDPVVALVDGSRALAPEIRNILHVGAGSYHLIRLDESGRYLQHAENSLCASGTGAFLDQQALRLGLEPEELARCAERVSRKPGVATRCAVFAKTDMIHLQQEGYLPEEIAAGLCGSLGRAVIDAVAQGQPIRGETAFVGGVALNDEVVASVRRQVECPVVVPDRPELVAALGAALAARERGPASHPFDPGAIRRTEGRRGAGAATRPPLELELSAYPSFDYHLDEVDEHGTEISVPDPLPPGDAHEVFLGLDIGSTSTKAVLLSREAEVLALFYRKTAGDPIRATQKVFTAARSLEERLGVRFEVLAAGTTGSGRKMIRRVIGAEMERDEITAHARAATHLDPEVDTILEIGGQDAKFTQLTDGVVTASVMNYVCAAGTGSFIEEQAAKLGIPLREYAEHVTDALAPYTSDRCTVFMERDLDLLLAAGRDRRELAAAVLYSVRDNYLNKVVGQMGIGDRVYFQGATARNRALVAAFEEELKRPILVSRFCHVTGCLGIALMLRETHDGTPTTFTGFGFANRRVETSSEICENCGNDCALTIIRTEGETLAWGAKCGREYSEIRRAVKKPEELRTVEARRKLFDRAGSGPAEPRFRVGMPRSLTAYSHLPLWREIVEGLGGRLVLTKKTTSDTLREGTAVLPAEFCAPVLAGYGHLAELARREDLDFLLVPQMIRAERPEGITDSHFCPFVQSHAAVAKSLESLGLDPDRLVTPVVELNRSEKQIARAIQETLGRRMSAPLARTRESVRAGLRALREAREKLIEVGEATVERIERERGLGIVLVGRPYNLADEGLNLELPRKVAEKGFHVLPMDALRADESGLKREWGSMYWSYGQKILAAAQRIVESDRLFPIFFTSFSCGPDSYIISYFKEILSRRQKPYLILQLDAHGADAGYLTRVEAALESFRAWKPREPEKDGRPVLGPMTPKKRILIPPMEPIGARLFAACFRSAGYEAEVLPETEETLALGRKHTLGSECVPCPSTLGSIIHTIRERDLDPKDLAFFLPTACGPCRFGQYGVLDRVVFKRLGWDGITILAPSAINAYQGLPRALRRRFWDGILLSDYLRTAIHARRPDEVRPGSVDLVGEQAIQEAERVLADPQGDGAAALDRGLKLLADVPVHGERLPRIGIVGEIYVRNDPFINGDLVREIERLGGEARLTSIAEWILYTAYLRDHGIGHRPGGLLARIGERLTDRFLRSRELAYEEVAKPFLADRMEPTIHDIIEAGQRYFPLEFQGEAILTVGRAVLFIEREKVGAVVNASPTFCMPGTVTTAVFPRIEREYGVPVVCSFYDGTGDVNTALVPHLHYLRREAGSRTTSSRTKTTGSRA
jgi:predicted CoA-substrate-specific enzyme activase